MNRPRAQTNHDHRAGTMAATWWVEATADDAPSDAMAQHKQAHQEQLLGSHPLPQCDTWGLTESFCGQHPDARLVHPRPLPTGAAPYLPRAGCPCD